MAMEKNFDAKKAESKVYKAWEDARAFAAGANAAPGAETFTILIPPPNVTGALHVGHAFNNTLQDILIRWHRMRGFDTLWQPGTDHAGIATQLQVEKMLAREGNAGRAEMGRKAFVAKVWEWKEKYGSTIINQLKRLGASCDWDRNAFTMDEQFHDAVLKVFVDLYNKGLIYRGKRLVNWDPHFETAISDLEVENIEVDGHMWHFKYPLAGGATYEYVEKDTDGTVTLTETRNYISIATTRPETMLGDGAVAVHPEDERYAPIVGKLCEIPVGPKAHRRLIPIITDTYPVMDFGSGAVKITGAHDLNDYGVAKRAHIPMYRLMNTKAQMRNDGAPYAETAARAREIAEGADWAEAEIDSLNLVPDAYRGMDRFEARKAVVADITAEGLAVMVPDPQTKVGESPTLPTDDRRVGGSAPAGSPTAPAMIPYVENKKIMQPFCDRSRVVMEPMLTDQWYVDAEKLAVPAREAVRSGRTTILPESGEKVYFHWLENIEPWCISRQLWWGHQIPVWYGPEPDRLGGDSGHSKAFCGASWEIVKTEALEYYSKILSGPVSISEATEKDMKFFEAGEPDWKSNLPEKEDTAFPTSTGVFQNLDTNEFEVSLYRDPDVLDTWFSSGLWPIGTLGWPNWTDETKKYFPTSTLITGQDILFFWVARMMMMQLEVAHDIPFKTVYLHQLVRDERGVKMSKTLGNVIDPLDMIDEFGADALRFTMTSMAAIGGSLKLSMERVKGYRNFGTKLWNAARFAEMNGVFAIKVFKQGGQISVKSLKNLPETQETLNKWIIGEVAKTLESVNAALAAYRFNDAANTLYSFVWGTFCDWYIEFSKPLLYGDNQAILAETRSVMAWAFDQCLIMLHPIMPFITEELWSLSGNREKMLIHADWPTYQVVDLIDKNADAEMNWVIDLIDSIRSVRTQMHVPAGLKIPMLQIDLDTAGQTAWTNNRAPIMRIARIVSLTAAAEIPKGAVTIPVQGGIFALPLADIIDLDGEKARLNKALAKISAEISSLSTRLNNAKFVASAPARVVTESRQHLDIQQEAAKKLHNALKRLDNL